jgi:hypothetical protein
MMDCRRRKGLNSAAIARVEATIASWESSPERAQSRATSTSKRHERNIATPMDRGIIKNNSVITVWPNRPPSTPVIAKPGTMPCLAG